MTARAGGRWRCSTPLKLPLDERGRRRAAARAEWFAAADQPLELHDICRGLDACVPRPSGHCAGRANAPLYGQAESPPETGPRWRKTARHRADRRPQRAGRDLAARRDRRVPRAGAQRSAPADAAGPARPADLRARRHHEPAADLGYRLPAAGRHVPRGGRDRRARRPARLFPRPRRMPRLALGVATPRAARRADGRGSTAAAATPRSARCWRMRAARREQRQGAGAGLRRRRHGGDDRRSVRARPASSACSACRPSCSRRATTRSPSRRSARSRGCRAAPIAASIRAPRIELGRAAARGRGLCGRRHEGARRPVGAARRRRHQAAGADEIAMATRSSSASSRWSWSAVGAQRAIARPIRKMLGERAAGGRRHRRARRGGVPRLARPARDRDAARRSSGLGLLGWLPFGAAGFGAAHPEERRARSRGCARPSSRWSSITTPARCAAACSPGRTRARRSRRSTSTTLLGSCREIDEESRALLVAYLDRREPGWREHAQGGATAGQGGARAPAK